MLPGVALPAYALAAESRAECVTVGPDCANWSSLARPRGWLMLGVRAQGERLSCSLISRVVARISAICE